MKVTKVYINKYVKDSLLGYASITIDDALVIKSLRIMDGKDGAWLSFPSKKDNNGEWKDLVFITDKELRREVTEAVMLEYNKDEEAPQQSTPVIEEKAPIKPTEPVNDDFDDDFDDTDDFPF